MTGTPTTAGSYTFTSKVVDSKGSTDTATCTIVVIAPPIDLQCGTCGANKGYTGSAFSPTFRLSAVRVRHDVLDHVRLAASGPYSECLYRYDHRHADHDRYLHLYVEGG